MTNDGCEKVVEMVIVRPFREPRCGHIFHEGSCALCGWISKWYRCRGCRRQKATTYSTDDVRLCEDCMGTCNV